MDNRTMASLDRPNDSLDAVELVMAIEEALGPDESMSADVREQLVREILARRDNDEFWEDDDALAILVRKLRPKGPKGRSGVAVLPEVESDTSTEDENPNFRGPKPPDSLRDTA
jgi:hypothetical protein